MCANPLPALLLPRKQTQSPKINYSAYVKNDFDLYLHLKSGECVVYSRYITVFGYPSMILSILRLVDV